MWPFKKKRKPLTKETACGLQQPFELYLDPGRATVDDLVELFNSMSALHRAMGGLGLTFAPHETDAMITVATPIERDEENDVPQ